MKVLVTGGEGQLGRCLAERARGTDAEIVAIDRAALDLAVRGSAGPLIASIAPDAVVNAAAYTVVDQAEAEPDRAFAINADGASELASAAATIGAPMIQLSTDYVFDGSQTIPYGENDPTDPLNVYGRSKLAGEQAVLAANPRGLILRTAWVYSPFGRNFVKTMMAAADTRDSLQVVDDQHGSPTSALDLADVILQILRRWKLEPMGQGGTYHAAGSDRASWYDLARGVMNARAALGLKVAAVHPIGSESWPTPAARPSDSVLDCAKLARDFGKVLPGWKHSLPTVVERLAGPR